MRHCAKHLATLALTALLGILPAMADVVFDETNFPDANFRQYLKDNFSSKGFTTEGVTITTANLNSITSINCSSKSIASLKGIEYFTALTSLDCSYNQLTELNMTQNADVKTLNCYRNQLTALNVTGCTALTQLKCDVNKLTELDVSTNTALIELICGSNQLTELNMTRNTKLSWLNCQLNKLTELDMTKNTALT